MKKLVAMFLSVVFVLGMMATASAAANVTWNAQNVYFAENGMLIVEGSFNNNGSHDGTVVDVKLRVFKRTENGDEELTWAGFNNVGAFVPSKGTTPWRFSIEGVEYTRLTQWRVSADVRSQW